MKKVSIIDLEVSNLFSIRGLFDKIGYKSEIIKTQKEFEDIDVLVIPGVGTFQAAMNFLNKQNLANKIKDYAKQDKPIIGICLGMQLLFSESNEIKKTKGLNLIEGEVEKFSAKNVSNAKVSFNVGWNKINTKKFKKNISYVSNLDRTDMYFIHSYFVKPKIQEIRTSTSFFYKTEFISSVKKNHIQGFQFHPEKSGECGIQIYKRLKKNLENKK